MFKASFKLARALKIGVPITLGTLIPIGIGAVALSPWAHHHFIAADNIVVGYDSTYALPLYANKYVSFLKNDSNQSHIVVTNPISANWKQAYNIPADTYQDHVVSDPVDLTTTSKDGHVVYNATLNREQLTQLFNKKHQPILGLHFQLQVTQVDKNNQQASTLKPIKHDMIVSVDLNQLSVTKQFTTQLFTYDVNNDFSDFLGSLVGNLTVNMAHNDHLSLSLSLDGSNISNTDTKSVHHLQAQLLPITTKTSSKLGNQDYLQPIIFFNDYDNSDVTSWFWPPPAGPGQSSSVTTPSQVDSYVVNHDQYTSTKTSYNDNSTTNYSFTNRATDNTATTNNTTASQNLYELTLTRAQWQEAFYNHWDNPPANPGVQVRMNLYFQMYDASTGQYQSYHVPVFSYFNMDKIVHLKTYDQVFVDYDLGAARSNNAGSFQLKMHVSTTLDGTMHINFSAVNHDLRSHVSAANPDGLPFDKINFDVNDVSVVGFANTTGSPTKPSDLKADIAVTKNVTNSNYVALVSDIHVRSGPGLHVRHGYFSNSDPYLYTMPPVFSKVGTIDLTSDAQNNNDFAKNSFLRFDFAGTRGTNNQPYIQTYSNSSHIKQVIILNNGYTEQGNQTYLGAPYKLNNQANDQANQYFALPISKITAYPSSSNNKWNYYTWKQLFTAWDNFDLLNQYHNLKVNKFDWQSPKWNGGTPSSAIYAQFAIQVRLAKPNDYLHIQYQLVAKAQAYSWYWMKNDASSRGNAGYSLKDIQIKIRPNWS